MLSCVYDYSHVNHVCGHKIPESHSQKACISTQRFVTSDARCLGVKHVADLHAARGAGRVKHSQCHAEAVYKPGGKGHKRCRDEFEEVASPQLHAVRAWVTDMLANVG